MASRGLLMALALGTTVGVVPRAHAFVIYTVNNPVSNFTLFTFDSPSFITTDTVVPVAGLAFAAPQNSITSVEFNPSSTDPAHLGLPEVAVFQSSGGADQTSSGDQFRWFPVGTFAEYGVTPGLAGSFGYPNSQLVVEASEPPTITVVIAGLLALFTRPRRSGPGLKCH